MRFKLTLNLIILLNTMKDLTIDAVTVKGYCSNPGMPHRAQLSPIQTLYTEDDTVIYTCDDYIDQKQYRKCVKGKWMGESARCGNVYKDNDLKMAKIYDKESNQLIKVYNTTNALDRFEKFTNSFIAERYAIPLRAYGSKGYRIELSLTYEAMFPFILISLSVVNNLIDERIKQTKYNITRVSVSPYRECRPQSYNQVSPWFYNSTRYDSWFNCESKDEKSYEKELTHLSKLVTYETQASDVLDIDLAAFILAQQHTHGGKPICGAPEVPIGLAMDAVLHLYSYNFRCLTGFTAIGSPDSTLTCGTDMLWKGSLPKCVPQKTCKAFELNEKHSTEVFLYENVFYLNTSVWFATEGTKAHFRCKDDIQILIGKEYRVCGKDGKWSDSLPNCLDPVKGFSNDESKMTFSLVSIIAMGALVLIITLIVIIVLCFLRMRKMSANKDKDISQNDMFRDSNIYDDYDTGPKERNIETSFYEQFDKVGEEERYAPATAMAPMYTPMEGMSYKYKYHDKNVYDDCIE